MTPFPGIRAALAASSTRTFAGLAALIVLGSAQPCAAEPSAAQAVEGIAAESADVPKNVIETDFAIDDADPESSVPTPEQAMRNPLHMGYFVMALSDGAEAALAKQQPAKAARYFRAMAKAAPDRAVGYRKACVAHDAAAQPEQAIETCRQALGKGGVTVKDHTQFVQVLLKKQTALTSLEIADADAVLKRLTLELGLGQQQEGRKLLADLHCQLGTRLEDAARLSACTEELRKAGADPSRILAYDWALAISKADVSAAETIVERARQAKLPAGAIARMEQGLQQIKDARRAALIARLTSFWPVAVAALLALLAWAAVKLRRRARLDPA